MGLLAAEGLAGGGAGELALGLLLGLAGAEAGGDGLLEPELLPPPTD